MFYPYEVIEEIRLQNDIVDIISSYTQLKQNGSRYTGLCPFHNEKTPSFSVSRDKQLYHCFGCGASGTVFNFVMEKENFDYSDAIKYLANRIHYTLPEKGSSTQAKKQQELKKTIIDMNKKAARFFYDNLSKDIGRKAVEYMDNRKLSSNARIKFGLGISPKRGNTLYNELKSLGYADIDIEKSGLVVADKKGGYYDRFSERLMFPIFDALGNIIGFGGRILDKGEPKYLNSPDTPAFDKKNTLYGLNFARQSKSKELILVEGYMDVIALHQAGFINAIASLGTAFGQTHARLAKRYADSIVILFDSDTAGEAAVMRAIPFLYNEGFTLKVLQLQDAKDPDEYIALFGIDKFKYELSRAENHILFLTKMIIKKYDTSDPLQKINAVNELVAILSKLKTDVEIDVYIDEVIKKIDIKKSVFTDEIKKIRGSLPEMPIIKYKKNMNALKSHDAGVDEAKRALLSLMTTDKRYSETIGKYIAPDEFMNPLYITLYEKINELHIKQQEIIPASLLSFFEPEEQPVVSKIFNINNDYYEEKDKLKAINERIKIIKEAYLINQKNKAVENDDFELLTKYVNELKNLKSQYITSFGG